MREVDLQGVVKRNHIIVFVQVDQDNKTIKLDKTTGTYEHIANIKEHIDRIQLMSEGCEIWCDYATYLANDKKRIFTKNFTRVFRKNFSNRALEIGQIDKYTNIHDIREIHNVLRMHEYNKQTPLFITGTADFVAKLLLFVDTVLVTQIEASICDENEDNIQYDIFPMSAFKQVCRRSKTYCSDVSDMYKRIDTAKKSAKSISNNDLTQLAGLIEISDAMEVAVDDDTEKYRYHFKELS